MPFIRIDTNCRQPLRKQCPSSNCGFNLKLSFVIHKTCRFIVTLDRVATHRKIDRNFGYAG